MLSDFADEICMVVIFVLCLVLGPLLVFAPRLAVAKQAGLLKYETLGERYVRKFDAKWLHDRYEALQGFECAEGKRCQEPIWSGTYLVCGHGKAVRNLFDTRTSSPQRPRTSHKGS